MTAGFPQLLLRLTAPNSSGDVGVEYSASPGYERFVPEVQSFPVPGVSVIDESAGDESVSRASALSLVPAADSRFTITMSTQCCDPAADPRVYFRQVIVTSRIGWRAALRSWGAADWRPPGDLPAQPESLANFPQGTVISDQTLRDYLTRPDWPCRSGRLSLLRRQQLLQQIVCATIAAMGTWNDGDPNERLHLMINAEPDFAALLLYGVSWFLPEGLLSRIGFAIGVADSEHAARHCGSVPALGICRHDDGKETFRRSVKRGIFIDTFLARRGDTDWGFSKPKLPPAGRPDSDVEQAKQIKQFVAELMRLAVSDWSRLEDRHNEFGRLETKTLDAWQSVSPLRDQLMRGQFEEWNRQFQVYCVLIGDDPNNGVLRQYAIDQLQFAKVAPHEIPFRYRYVLWNGLKSRDELAGNDHELKALLAVPNDLLVLTNADDVDDLGAAELEGPLCGTLLADCLKRGYAAEANRDGLRSLFRSVAEVLLTRLPQPEDVDLVHQFVRKMQHGAKTPDERPELALLLKFAEERGLQLLLTLQACGLNPHIATGSSREFSTKALLTREALKAVLSRDDVCWSLNDPGWPPACRARALEQAQLKQLVSYLDQLGLDDLLRSLLTELGRELDHRVLDRSQPPTRPRMLFEFLSDHLNSQRPLMEKKLSAEITDWDKLDARCGPLWPDLSDKVKDSKRWIGKRPALWWVAAAMLVLAFGAGIFQGWPSLPSPLKHTRAIVTQ